MILPSFPIAHLLYGMRELGGQFPLNNVFFFLIGETSQHTHLNTEGHSINY